MPSLRARSPSFGFSILMTSAPSSARPPSRRVATPSQRGDSARAAALLLAVFFIRELYYVSYSSPTFDEAQYTAYGFSLLKKGDFRLANYKPDLVPVLSALPLLATAAYFASQGALGEMIQGLLWAPRHYTQVNQLPYGFISMRISDWVELFDSGPLAERGLALALRRVALAQHTKRLATFTAEIHLHREVRVSLSLRGEPEAGEREG